MYLIIGASGYLGRYYIKNILDMTSESIVATYSTAKPDFAHPRVQWQKLDICNQGDVESLRASLQEPPKIIYCSAYHHPDKVEENPETAWNVNITSLAAFVNMFHDALCFYYISTDSVYGEGAKDIYFTEEHPLNPVNLYGKHKVLAEQITLAKGFNVIRYPFIIGTSLVETKKHFYDHIIADFEASKILEMFDDSYRSTLDFNQCASLLIELIEKYGTCPQKVLNIAGDDVLSKYEVALLMAEKFNFDKKQVKGIPVASAEHIFKAKRASSAALDNTKCKQLLRKDRIVLEF